MVGLFGLVFGLGFGGGLWKVVRIWWFGFCWQFVLVVAACEGFYSCLTFNSVGMIFYLWGGFSLVILLVLV